MDCLLDSLLGLSTWIFYGTLNLEKKVGPKKVGGGGVHKCILSNKWKIKQTVASQVWLSIEKPRKAKRQ